ncbi:hypothetical protein B0H14DRAFT_3657742 [Mycena olivaceomarginata]|nr:hypothetical protein B0H14DRAFT_2580841 [Mycena olivaceomarginata]KAJ7852677.1 hypothetical protein B0H14DRAFT_3657742 [Mycena olivaceomarginata]
MAPPLPNSSLIVEDWFHGLYTAALLVTFCTISEYRDFDWIHSRSNLNYTFPISYQQVVFWIPEKKQDQACPLGMVDDQELPTGPGLLYSLTHLKVWLEGTGDTFFCINIFMADCLFIWRCWVVWNCRWPVVVLPIFATIAGAVLAGFIISDQVSPIKWECCVARRLSQLPKSPQS